MSLALRKEAFGYSKINPVLWLIRKCILVRHTDFIVSEHLIEILLSAFGIIVSESELLNFTLMLFKENDGIQSLISLLPNLHDEEMSIEGILPLLVCIRGKHCEH